MLELGLLRKNKVNLSDYNSQKEIESRILLADFSSLDLSVLEEIVFSPLKISCKKLLLSLQVPESQLLPILGRFARVGLLSRQGDLLLVDKEIRKSFEFEMQRFDPDFKPDMEFLQGLLRKVPIHLLPTWYSTPRSSNNLFGSIVEKHLLTPHTFQRYLDDLHFVDSTIRRIIDDLFASADFTLSSTDVIAKYNLTRARFEEILLNLEFHFVGTVRYVQEEDHWHEIITPFAEWHAYQLFLQAAKVPPIDTSRVSPKKRSPLKVEALERQRQSSTDVLRDMARCMQDVLHGKWVFVEDFVQHALIPTNVDSITTLQKTGSHWKYNTPPISEGEKARLRTAIVDTLFLCDAVKLGTAEGRDCFALTSFGRSVMRI